jgi:hypothetical protein
MSIFAKLKRKFSLEEPNSEVYFGMLQGAMYLQLDGAIEHVTEQLNDSESDEEIKESLGDIFLEIDYGSPEDCRDTLAHAWGIDSTESTLEILEYLRTEGHRTRHEMLAKLIIESGGTDSILYRAPWEQICRLVDDCEDDDEEQIAAKRRQMQIIQANLSVFESVGTLGWDVARHSHVIKLAVSARHLTRTQGNEQIVLFNSLTREKFEDWADFANSYMLGFQLFCGGGSNQPSIQHFRDEMGSDMREHFDEVQDAVRLLRNHPNSPWLAFGW